jgi:hypothetical protein
MRAWLVVVVACGSPPTVVQPPKLAQGSPPELVTTAPGATSFAVDRGNVYWLAPGSGVFELAAGSGSAQKLGDVDAKAHDLAFATSGSASALLYIDGGNRFARLGAPPPAELAPEPNGRLVQNGRAAIAAMRADDGWRVSIDEHDAFQVDGDVLALAITDDGRGVTGTTTSLYRGSAATPVDGGVHAIALDGDDIFFANTALFEKYGNGPINKLGPAGGPVTAMALDADFIYWAIAAGERDPAIYRARRAKPEMELFTKVGGATQLIVDGAFVYWLDSADGGAIRRIRRPQK